MNRKLKIVLFSILFLFLVSFTGLKANNDTDVSMVEGASIRDTSEGRQQGLRFTAKLEGDNGAEHGFYLVFGKATKDDLLDALAAVYGDEKPEFNEKEIHKVSVDGTTGNGEFRVVLVGIPTEGYLQDITVFSYVGDEIAEIPVTRSIGEVALRLKQQNNDIHQNVLDELGDTLLFRGEGIDIPNSNNIEGVVLPKPTKEGYSLVGWALTENGEAEELLPNEPYVLFPVWRILNAQIVYDFSDLEGTGGTAYSKTTLGELLENEYFDEVLETTYIYNGYNNDTKGVLKVSSTSNNGSMKFKLKDDILIKTVVIVAEPGDSTTTLKINDVDVELSNIPKDRFVIELTEKTNTIEIVGTKRTKIYSLELYGEDIEVPATEHITIKFDFDYDNKEEEITIIKGKTVELLNDPVRADYDFLGWFLDEETEYVGQILNKDTTITAKWEKIIVEDPVLDAEITYSFNKLTGNENTEILDLEEIGERFMDDLFNEVTSSSRVYFGNGYIKFGTGNYNGELTLKFNDDVKIKTIVFYASGWENADVFSVNGEEKTLTKDLVGGFVITLDEATNLIEIVTKQRASLYGIEFYGPEIVPPQPISYTVTFDSNGGSGIDSVEVWKVEPLVRPSNPVYEGYEFLGWYLDETEFTFNEIIENDITLHAKWEKLADDEYIYELNMEKLNLLGNTYTDIEVEEENITWQGKANNTSGNIGTNGATNAIEVVAKSGYYFYSIEVSVASAAAGSRNIKIGEITIASGVTSSKPIVATTIFEEELTSMKLVSSGALQYVYIKVVVKELDLTNEEKVDLIIDDLKIVFASGDNQDSVTKNLELIPKGPEGDFGTIISWSSNEPQIISSIGEVTRPENNDVDVIITATVTLNGVSESKQFVLTVIAEGQELELEPFTITLTESSIWDARTDSYADGSFEKDFNGITIKSDDEGFYTGSSYGDDKIQVRKNYGWIYNTNILDGYVIKSVTVNGKSAGTTNIYFSTTESKPTTNGKIGVLTSGDVSSENYIYFYIKDNNGSGTITIDSIVIEFVPKP